MPTRRTQLHPITTKMKVVLPQQAARSQAFTLVEVTLALGLVSFVLLSLLGLFVVGLTSSRDSSLETALSKIAVDVSSSYDSTLPSPYTNAYNYEGLTSNQAGSSFQKNFTAKVSTNSTSMIANTSTNLVLITISITSVNNPSVTNIIQTSAYLP
jgi:uncharacterized protein (TIGR02598 family)